MREFLLLALRNLSHRRLRSLLTIIGIFIGIATVVALLSLGQGLQDTIAGEFQKLGADKITIMGSSGFTSSPLLSASTAKPLNSDDLKAVQKVRGVDLAGALLFKSSGVTFKRESKQTYVLGVPTDGSEKVFEETQFGNLLEGRHLRAGERDKVVVGHSVHTKLFAKPVNVGDSIEVNDLPVKVVGVYSSIGNEMDDNAVYMTLDDIREKFDEPKLVSMILVKVRGGENMTAVADTISDKLRKLKGQKKGEETFSASTPQQLEEKFNTIFGIVQFVLLGIAAISLVVGGIGIMNTMYTSILERTKEIGLLKAVGAKNRDILVLFLTESGLLGLIGGVVGVLFGAVLSRVAEAGIRQGGYAAFNASLGWELIVGVLVFSFLVGAISGTLPARSAAKMNPTDALRYE